MRFFLLPIYVMATTVIDSTLITESQKDFVLEAQGYVAYYQRGETSVELQDVTAVALRLVSADEQLKVFNADGQLLGVCALQQRATWSLL